MVRCSAMVALALKWQGTYLFMNLCFGVCVCVCVCVCMCVWCGCWTVHPSVHSRLLTVILIPLQISKYWPSISLPIPLSGFIFHSCFLITTVPSLSRTECMGGKWVLSQWKNTAVPNSHIHIGTHSCTRNPTFLSNHLFSQQASALNDRSFARVLQASGEVCSCP